MTTETDPGPVHVIAAPPGWWWITQDDDGQFAAVHEVIAWRIHAHPGTPPTPVRAPWSHPSIENQTGGYARFIPPPGVPDEAK